MQPCSRCLEPVGDDAVLLKNGLYMCPSCYQYRYPVKKEVNPQRFFVSVEGVLAVVLTVGGMVGAYTVYKNHLQSARTEALELKAAEEAAEIRKKELRDVVDVARQKDDSERIAAEAQRALKREADKVAAAEALVRENEQKRIALEEKNKAEQERKAALAAERERTETLEGAKKRAAEWVELNAKSVELSKTISKSEEEKTAKQKSATIHGVIFDARKTALEDAWKQYRLSKPGGTGGKEIWEIEWQANAFVTTRVFGGASYLAESQGPKVAKRLNDTAADARFNLDAMKTEKKEIDALTKLIADSQSKREIIAKRMAELKRIDPTITATPIDADVHPLGFKTIYKKDGTTIQALSIMKVDNEVRYRDEKGEWQTVSADDVARIDANSAGKP